MKPKLSKAALEFFKQHGSEGGKIGGAKTSKAKKKTARANGKLGGRPKKEEVKK